MPIPRIAIGQAAKDRLPAWRYSTVNRGCGVLVMALPCLKPLRLYRQRDPHASDLWRLIDEHFDSFQQVYDERFQAKYGYWRPIVEQSVAAFLKCGDLQEGFARVRCPDCKHEMFVALPRLSRPEGRWNASRREAQLSDPPAVGFSGRVHPAHSGKGITLDSLLWMVLEQVARHAQEGESGSIRRAIERGDHNFSQQPSMGDVDQACL